MIVENIFQRFYWIPWSMDMCYGVEYINTTIAKTKPMIEIYPILLKYLNCNLNIVKVMRLELYMILDQREMSKWF
jgi:hypothetical protein